MKEATWNRFWFVVAFGTLVAISFWPHAKHAVVLLAH